MKIKTENGKEYIFDIVRKKYVRNQPEEWVRQNIIEYLNKKKGYPVSLMSIEKKNTINNIKKRCDIVCNNQNGEPLLLVECKSQNIALNSKVFDQSINYQNSLKARFTVVTNGKSHYCFEIQKSGLIFSKTIPSYKELTK